MTFNYLKVIVLLLLLPSIGFSQQKDSVLVIWYEDHTRYCLTEDQALLTVELDKQNEVHKGKVLDLEGKVKALEEKISAKATIIEATESIVDVEKERTEIEKQKVKFADRFQLITSGQFGAGATYTNQINGLYGGFDIGLKFKSGTFFSIGYMAGSSHFVTIRVGQVVKFRKPKIKDLILK